jgi:predicted alpha/beta hydrolase family esterase
MNKRVFIIHGWGGGPEGGCIPWLKDELEKQGLEVIAPQMPDTENPSIGKWVSYLADLVGSPNENTYFVGHSIGCQTIMRYLQTIDAKVDGVLFIAGWFVLENLENEDILIAKPWIGTPIDFEKLRNVSEKYTVLISDNDPFEGFEENKNSFEKLGAKIIIMKGAGHIENIELPIALEELLKMMSKKI